MRKETIIILAVICLVNSSEISGISQARDQPIQFKMHKTGKNEISASFFKNFAHNLEDGAYKLAEGVSLLDLVRQKSGLYTIQLLVGYPPQAFEVIVDTGSFLLWIPGEGYNSPVSTSPKHTLLNTHGLHKKEERMALKYISGRIEGFVSYAQLSLNSQVSLPKFDFLLTDRIDAPVNVDGIIGFAREYSVYPENFSLIDSLYKNGSIKSKVFSQVIQDDSAVFTVGSLHPEISGDMANFRTCQAIVDRKDVKMFWTCGLESVFFRGDTSQNSLAATVKVSEFNQPAIFDTGSNVIIAPGHFYQKFKDVFFKKAIENKHCDPLVDNFGNSGITCRNELDFSIFPKILFRFEGGSQVEVEPQHLFDDIGSGKVFRVVFSYVPGGGWLLGQPFLSQSHVVFNHEENTVGFYKTQNQIQEFDYETLEEHLAGPSIYYLSLQCYIISQIIGLLFLLFLYCAKLLWRKNSGKTFMKEKVEEKRKNLLTAFNPKYDL